jgi:hypothetical protein
LNTGLSKYEAWKLTIWLLWCISTLYEHYLLHCSTQ